MLCTNSLLKLFWNLLICITCVKNFHRVHTDPRVFSTSNGHREVPTRSKRLSNFMAFKDLLKEVRCILKVIWKAIEYVKHSISWYYKHVNIHVLTSTWVHLSCLCLLYFSLMNVNKIIKCKCLLSGLIIFFIKRCIGFYYKSLIIIKLCWKYCIAISINNYVLTSKNVLHV